MKFREVFLHSRGSGYNQGECVYSKLRMITCSSSRESERERERERESTAACVFWGMEISMQNEISLGPGFL